MVYDDTAEGSLAPSNAYLMYEAPWENSSWNPRGCFGVYERINDTAEDSTLMDLWVDEGLPPPRVNGAWDRAAGWAWLQGWINATFDSSQLATVPRNHSEWRDFIPLAKQADAKVLWFNFRSWDWTSIDNANPKCSPMASKALQTSAPTLHATACRCRHTA